MELAGYFSLVVIGIVLAMIGGGGSILAIPVLVYLFSLDVVTASSYSLFVVGITSLIGAGLKQKDLQMDWRAGSLFTVCSAAAIFSTRMWIIPRLPEEIFVGDFSITRHFLIMSVFVVLAVASAATILIKNDPAYRTGQTKKRYLIPVGLGTGMLVGFVGAGGGFLVLPALTILAGLPFRIAVGTTLIVISINSLFGFLGDVMNYEINWIFLLLITGYSALGMVVGDLYSRRIDVARLRASFGWIILTVALGVIINEFVFSV